MTERLIARLRDASDDRWSDTGRLCGEAADEIERLAKELEISRKKEIKFRKEEPVPFIIKDEP
jgi:hypothetical protein